MGAWRTRRARRGCWYLRSRIRQARKPVKDVRQELVVFCATGEFILVVCLRSGPTSCAANIVASPKAATRPSPTRNAAPWYRPPTGTRGVLESHCQATVGISEPTSSPRTRRGWAFLFASTWKADPVKLATESTLSLWVRSSVMGLPARDPSSPVLSGGFWVE
jgi:hypothetical protein